MLASASTLSISKTGNFDSGTDRWTSASRTSCNASKAREPGCPSDTCAGHSLPVPECGLSVSLAHLDTLLSCPMPERELSF